MFGLLIFLSFMSSLMLQFTLDGYHAFCAALLYICFISVVNTGVLRVMLRFDAADVHE